MHPKFGRKFRLASMFLFSAAAPGVVFAQSGTADAELQGVTVGATRSEVKAAPEQVDVNATETKDIITRTKIEQLGTTTDFLYTLSDLPNTVVWDGGGNTISGAKINMNGFDYTRINFQLDGIPINDAGSYSFYSYQYAQNDIIKSIVVTPGAGNAATVGLSAIGGNIAINTDDADSHFYLQPRLGAGSYNKYEEAGKVSSGTFLQGIAPTGFFVAATHTTSQSSFQNNSGSRDNVAFKSNTALFGGKFSTFFDYNNQAFAEYDGCEQSGINSVGDSCNFYNSNPINSSTSAGAKAGQYNTSLNYTSYRNWIAYADYTIPLGAKSNIDEKFYYYSGNGYGGSGYAEYLSAAATTETLTFQPEFEKTNQWGNILKADIALGHGATLQPGMWFQMDKSQHYAYYENPNTGEQIANPYYDEYVRTLTSTPYLNLNLKPFENLIIDIGTKYMILDRDYFAPAQDPFPTTTVNQKGDQYYTTQFRNILPSIGANYEFSPGYHLYANYSRNARPPGYSEFYESGDFQVENDLKPEKTNSYQAGMYLDRGPFEGRATVFDTHYQDYIQNLSVSNGGSGYLTEVRNVGDAHYVGATLALTYLFTPWLQGFANLGVIKTWIDQFGSGPAAYSPNQTQSTGLFANYHGFSATVSIDHAGQRSYLYVDSYDGTNPATYLTLHSLTTANASFGYTWKLQNPWLKEVDTHVALRNISNNREPVDMNIGAANSYSTTNPLYELNTPFTAFFQVSAKLF